MAYGLCGLMPDQFRRLTPAEFSAIARGNLAEVRRLRSQADALNAAMICHIRLAHGDKEATSLEKYTIYKEAEERKPADHLVKMMERMAAGGAGHG